MEYIGMKVKTHTRIYDLTYVYLIVGILVVMWLVWP